MNCKQRYDFAASLTEAQRENLQKNLVLPAMEYPIPESFGMAERKHGDKIRIKAGSGLTMQTLNECCVSARGEMHLLGTLVNLMAELALNATADALKDAGLLRHGIKRGVNDTRAALAEWKRGMSEILTDRWDMVDSMCSDRMGECLHAEAETLQRQYAAVMRRRKHKHPDIVAGAEFTGLLFAISGRLVSNLAARWGKTGADFTPIFRHFDLSRTCGGQWRKVCAALYTEEDHRAMSGDRDCYNAFVIFARDACSLEALIPHIHNLAMDEYAAVFSDANRADIQADYDQTMAEKAAERAKAEKANADYWRGVKKRAKQAAADITAEDLADLAEHFGEWGAA